MKTYAVGQQIKFWSERVFGVPVDATILRILGSGKLRLEAYYNGVKWRATIHPGRIVTPLANEE